MKRSTEFLKRTRDLVVRAAVPQKGKISVQRMSLILVVLSFLLGMIDATAVEERLFGTVEITAETQKRKTTPSVEPGLGVTPGTHRLIRTNAGNGDLD